MRQISYTAFTVFPLTKIRDDSCFCCGDCRRPRGYCPLVDRQHPSLSLVRQCALLGVSRSSLYYRPKAASAEDLSLMGEMDRQYLETPYFGSIRIKA